MSFANNEASQKSLCARLARVEGQLRVLQKLIQSDAEPEKVAQQMAAARKALDNGGYIYVWQEMLPDGCRVRVLDNGRGIPPEALTHLTEAFYRVDKSRSRAQGGAGLGLSLCNEIVQLHDPSAHAEMQAIRSATHLAQDPSLAGCTIYASGHPCPMCLAAIVMTGMERVFFAFDNVDAAPYGLSSEGTYQRLRLSLDPSPLPIARVETGVSAAQLYGDAPWSL